ncbi:hypothetical protein [Clostridium paraputrificum]|uniref:Uncharacterized protein n=1 Tax=Clostridium paraputrificum TaxID=29363 RepID=A0A6N3F6G0_9CLOT
MDNHLEVVVNSFAADVVTNESIQLRKGPRDFVNTFSLGSNVLYDIGIDQSHSCTGICIQPVDGDDILILELDNKTLSLEHYRRTLKTILTKTLSKINIRYCVLEEPLPFISGNQNKALVTLKNDLISLFRDSGYFNIKHFDLIKPQSWRKGLITKDNPYGPKTKLATVHEIQKLYPVTKKFVPCYTHESGYDGFDACGIIIGYKQRHAVNNDSSITKILGPRNTTKQGCAIYCYCDANDQTELQELIRAINSYTPNLGSPVVKIYNDEDILYGNQKMSLVDDFTITAVTTPVDIVSVALKYKFTMEDGKQLFMIVLPLKKLKVSLIEYLEYNKIMYEEIY